MWTEGFSLAYFCCHSCVQTGGFAGIAPSSGMCDLFILLAVIAMPAKHCGVDQRAGELVGIIERVPSTSLYLFNRVCPLCKMTVIRARHT